MVERKVPVGLRHGGSAAEDLVEEWAEGSEDLAADHLAAEVLLGDGRGKEKFLWLCHGYARSLRSEINYNF